MSITSKDNEDQCILSSLITRLAPLFDFKNQIKGATVTYVNGTTHSVVSSMWGENGPMIKELMDISPAELSLLVPRIQLYRMKYEYNKKKASQAPEVKPILFKDHIHKEDLSRIFAAGQGRLGEVGIRSVNITQIGNTKDTLNLYQIRMKIFADSIDAFLNGHPEDSAPYYTLLAYDEYAAIAADLAINPKKTKVEKPSSGQSDHTSQIDDPTYFELQGVFGWSVPKDKVKLIRKPIMEALKHCEMVYKMGLTDHTMSFKQDGTIELDIEYNVSLERMMDSFMADLFRPVPSEVVSSPGAIPGVVSANSQKAKPPAPSDSPTEEKKGGSRSSDATEAARNVARSDIVALYSLLEPKLHFLTLKNVNLWKQWKKGGNTGGLGTEQVLDAIGHQVVDEGSTTVAGYANERAKSESKAGDSDKKVPKKPSMPSTAKEIPFLFLGDIIAAAVSLVQSDPSKLPPSIFKYRFLIGPVIFIDRLSGQKVSLNLGQIPVALSQFYRFLNEMIIKANKSRVTLKDFLVHSEQGLVNHLIPIALGGECLGAADIIGDALGELNKSVNMTMITHNDSTGQDKFASVAKGPNVINIKQMQGKFSTRRMTAPRMGKKGHDKLFTYPVIYASYLPVDNKSGDKEQDEQNGTFWFSLGKDRGLVKQMQFSKIQLKEVQTANMMRDGGAVASYMQARYSVQMSLHGFPFMSAGQDIHINPSIASLGDSRSKGSYGQKLGLTGYYYVQRVTHNITENNEFSTTVFADYNPITYPADPPVSKVTPTSENPDGSKKNEDKPKPGDNPDEKGEGEKGYYEKPLGGEGGEGHMVNEALTIADSILGESSGMFSGSPSVTTSTTNEIAFGPSTPSDEFMEDLADGDVSDYPSHLDDGRGSPNGAAAFANEILRHLNEEPDYGPVIIRDYNSLIEGSRRSFNGKASSYLDEEINPRVALKYYDEPHVLPKSEQIQCRARIYFNLVYSSEDIRHDTWIEGETRTENQTGRGSTSRPTSYVYECVKSPTGRWVVFKFFEGTESIGRRG